MMTSVRAEQNLFNVLTQDTNLITDMGDVITVRISNKNTDFYRPWFNGGVDLESKGFRGEGVWSDRVQTEANYIEYWHKGTLVLHLQRK